MNSKEMPRPNSIVAERDPALLISDLFPYQEGMDWTEITSVYHSTFPMWKQKWMGKNQLSAFRFCWGDNMANVLMNSEDTLFWFNLPSFILLCHVSLAFGEEPL